MGLKEQQAAIQRELDRFIDLLGVLLPRYSKLIRSSNLSESELQELGEIEHFLIGVSGRISEIKNILEQDVFGHGLFEYYKAKIKAINGDMLAQSKVEHLRRNFENALASGEIINWN